MSLDRFSCFSERNQEFENGAARDPYETQFFRGSGRLSCVGWPEKVTQELFVYHYKPNTCWFSAGNELE